jgi:hypothetical protein
LNRIADDWEEVAGDLLPRIDLTTVKYLAGLKPVPSSFFSCKNYKEKLARLQEMTERQILDFASDDGTPRTSDVPNYDSEVEESLKFQKQQSSSHDSEDDASMTESEGAEELEAEEPPTPIIYSDCSSEERYGIYQRHLRRGVHC